ncbi:MAG: hypothetical protein ABIH50_00980 [bacterium]
MTKYPWETLASLLVVGLGQIIKGQGHKGLRFILFFYFTLPSIVYLSLLLNATLFFLSLGAAVLLGIFIWGYNIWDAYNEEVD